MRILIARVSSHISLTVAALIALAVPAYADYDGIIKDGWGPRIKHAVDLISDAKFDEGLAAIDEYIEAFPNECGGYFFYAAAVQESLQKRNDLSLIPIFEKYAKKTKWFCGRSIAQHPERYADRMLLGAIHGYSGLIQARQREMIKAFMSAIEAKKLLEQVYRERPNMPDNNLALGLLYFFATRQSKKTGGVLGWIIKRFITHGENLHDEGVRMIEFSVKNNALSEPYGTASLMWIRLYERKYMEAKALGHQLAERYPNDTISRWVRGRCNLYTSEYGKALSDFARIETLLKGRGIDVDKKYSDVLMMQKWTKMRLAEEEGNFKEAIRLNNEFIAWLDSNPKIGIEYQAEDAFLSYWRNMAISAKRRIKNGNHRHAAFAK